MDDFWYPQRNRTDATVALLKNLIYQINFPISRLTIEKETKAHPEFPLLSFGAIIEILEKWGIKSISYNWEMEKLNEMPSPSILFLHDRFGDLKLGEFVLFNEINGDDIKYLHTRKGWVIENKYDFSQKWAKAALSLIELVSPDGEEDFEEKEKKYIETRNANPYLNSIKVGDDFLTDEECEYIINLSKPEFKRSKVFSEEAFEDHGRTSYTAELSAFPKDEVLEKIRLRASKLIKIPATHFEFFQCISYDKTQEYASHYDTFDESTEKGKAVVQEGGQRQYTMLVYLNDDFDGGGTHFPEIDLIVQPKKRRVVIFKNLDENDKLIKEALHAGLPVTQGRKYAMNMWVRNKPLRD